MIGGLAEEASGADCHHAARGAASGDGKDVATSLDSAAARAVGSQVRSRRCEPASGAVMAVTPVGVQTWSAAFVAAPRRRKIGLLVAATLVVGHGRHRPVAAGPGGSRGHRSRRSRGHVALRPGPQGLPRHGPQHHVEGLVHGRRRRALRRLLPDHRQHQRRDAAVRRHRRQHLHRPADPRHDLHRGVASTARAWRAGYEHRQERPVPRSSPTTSPTRAAPASSCAPG